MNIDLKAYQKPQTTKMERIAQFAPLNQEKAATSGFDTIHEQKFWQGIQAPAIPFAESWIRQSLNSQDENAVNESNQSEKQNAFWKKQSGHHQTESELKQFPADISSLIEAESIQEGYAELTDEHLEEYQEATQELAESLGAPKIDVGALTCWQDFQDGIRPIIKEIEEPTADEERTQQVADLQLMQKVCILLAKWGGFQVLFEY